MSKYSIVSSLFLLMVLAACPSCAVGNRLDTEAAVNSEVTGFYTLILYGCTHSEDLETLAILDKEGDSRTFEPFAPEYKYSVRKGVSGKEAIDEAEQFVGCNTSFRRAQLSRIFDSGGNTLGYEVRPLYSPFTYGVDDVLFTDYRVKDDKVIVTIRLIPSVEKMLRGDDGKRRD